MSMALRRPSVDNGVVSGGGPKLRRQSIDAGVVSAKRAAFIQTSAISSRHAMPYFRVENTYRLEPDVPFSAVQVRDVIKRVLETELKGVKYDPTTCNLLSSQLADSMKRGVKDIGYSRYKLIAMVALGQSKSSTVAFTSRCIWNDQVDTYSEYIHYGDDVYAVGLVYGIYCE